MAPRALFNPDVLRLEGAGDPQITPISQI
jgi:hypothetical protein